MKYSFKKHITNEYYLYIIFLISIIFMAIYILISIWTTFIKSGTIDLKIFLWILNDLRFMPIISFVFFGLLLFRVYKTKKFLKNCMEIDATIEKYEFYYGKYSMGKEGCETGIRITFSYTINNENYTKWYSIAKNKQTVKYFDLFKRKEENVKILVDNKNPRKIMIKEIFL